MDLVRASSGSSVLLEHAPGWQPKVPRRSNLPDHRQGVVNMIITDLCGSRWCHNIGLALRNCIRA